MVKYDTQTFPVILMTGCRKILFMRSRVLDHTDILLRELHCIASVIVIFWNFMILYICILEIPNLYSYFHWPWLRSNKRQNDRNLAILSLMKTNNRCGECYIRGSWKLQTRCDLCRSCFNRRSVSDRKRRHCSRPLSRV